MHHFQFLYPGKVSIFQLKYFNIFGKYRKPGLFWTERGYFGRSCFSMARAVLNNGAILDT